MSAAQVYVRVQVCSYLVPPLEPEACSREQQQTLAACAWRLASRDQSQAEGCSGQMLTSSEPPAWSWPVSCELG